MKIQFRAALIACVVVPTGRVFAADGSSDVLGGAVILLLVVTLAFLMVLLLRLLMRDRTRGLDDEPGLGFHRRTTSLDRASIER